MSWRSPAMVPLPANPASVRFPTEPLPRLAFCAAWRLRGFADAMAHGLRRVPGGGPQLQALGRIERALAASDAFAEHPALQEHDGGDTPQRLIEARLRLEPLPFVESWAEAGMADAVYGRALDRALEGLAGSRDAALAAAARRAPPMPPSGTDWVAAFAEDEKNRSCLQLLADRWVAASVAVFGRPGTVGDARASKAGWRPPAAEGLGMHLEEMERTIWSWGLEAPDAMFMGVEVPGGWTPRRRSKKPREH